jgi:hypothetical protein
MFGVVTLTGYEVEDIRVAQIGAPYTVGAYEIELVGVDENVRGPNYITTMASIAVREAESGRLVSQMHPERRIYPVAGMPTTEAGINNGFTRDVYVTLGDPQAGRRLGRADLDQALRQLDLGRHDHHGARRAASACRTGATASRRARARRAAAPKGVPAE